MNLYEPSIHIKSIWTTNVFNTTPAGLPFRDGYSESCDQSKLQPADSSNTTIRQAFHCRHIDLSFNCNLTAPIPISKSNLNCFHRLHVTFFKKTQFTTKINKYIPVSEQQVWKKNLNSQHFSMHELKIYYRFNNVLIFLKSAFRYVCEQHLIWTSGKE